MWWTEEVREVVKEKKKRYIQYNYKKSLQRNVPERVRNERKRVYIDCKRRVKQVIELRRE